MPLVLVSTKLSLTILRLFWIRDCTSEASPLSVFTSLGSLMYCQPCLCSCGGYLSVSTYTLGCRPVRVWKFLTLSLTTPSHFSSTPSSTTSPQARLPTMRAPACAAASQQTQLYDSDTRLYPICILLQMTGPSAAEGLSPSPLGSSMVLTNFLAFSDATTAQITATELWLHSSYQILGCRAGDGDERDEEDEGDSLGVNRGSNSIEDLKILQGNRVAAGVWVIVCGLGLKEPESIRQALIKDQTISTPIDLMQLQPQPQQQLASIRHLICLQLTLNITPNQHPKPCAEAISISAMLLHVNNQQVSTLGQFHSLVRPRCNPKISQQCEQATGVSNAEIKKAQELEAVLGELGQWLAGVQGWALGTSTFVVWGSDSIARDLLAELKVKKLQHPELINSYIDMQKVYSRTVKQQAFDLRQAAQQFKIDCQQAQNSSRGENTARILTQLTKQILMAGLWRPTRNHVQTLLQLPGINTTKQLQYLLVLDFEATCQDNTKLQPCSQIIQFPIMVVDLRTFQTVAQFHHYISPRFHPQLTPFCTQLTGITQQMVTAQPSLEQVLALLDTWLHEQTYLCGNNYTFVTCGDWDLATCLRQEARAKGITVPGYLKNYINIKKVYREQMGAEGGGMMGMLAGLGIAHIGRHHSGIDDVRNICAVCVGLVHKRGLKYDRKYINYVR